MVSMLCIRITKPGGEKALGSRTLTNSVVPYPTIAMTVHAYDIYGIYEQYRVNSNIIIAILRDRGACGIFYKQCLCSTINREL